MKIWTYKDVWVKEPDGYHRYWKERSYETYKEAYNRYFDLRSVSPGAIARMWRWSGSSWVRVA